MTAKLIDISAHNDWPSAQLLRTLDGIILRLAYNLSQDSKIQEFVLKAKQGGLPWAGYHFIKPGDGVKQAELAMRVADRVGGCPVIFMDREWEYGVIASAATADAYVNRIKKAGLKTGTYMSLSSYQSHGADIDWPALWSSNPANIILPPIYHAGDFLQYAGDGVPAGNRIDRDMFNGTPDQLRALFNSGVAQQGHVPPVVAIPPAEQPGAKGDPMFNLIPGTAARTVTLKPGAIFYDRSIGGTRYSAVPADAQPSDREFALLGAVASRYVVADGDYGVFVNRDADTVESVNQRTKNYGR